MMTSTKYAHQVFHIETDNSNTFVFKTSFLRRIQNHFVQVSVDTL